MARPKKPELEKSRQEFNALKPLPRYYGVRVAEHFPDIDIEILHQAVAGRVEYPEGLKALEAICAIYPRRKEQKAMAA